MKKKVVLKTYSKPDRFGIVLCETPQIYICIFNNFVGGKPVFFSKRKDAQGRHHNIGNHAFWIEFNDSLSSNWGFIYESGRSISQRGELQGCFGSWYRTPVQAKIPSIPERISEPVLLISSTARKANFAASKW